MDNLKCPYCKSGSKKNGFYFRECDGRDLRRYRCLNHLCRKTFSRATTSPRKYLKKRQNIESQRQMSYMSTSFRKMGYKFQVRVATALHHRNILAIEGKESAQKQLEKRTPAQRVQFDELFTFCESRLKVLRVAVAVCAETRQVLGFEVGQSYLSGELGEKCKARYPEWQENTAEARMRLWNRIKHLISPTAVIETDELIAYKEEIKEIFPDATHRSYTSVIGGRIGQGELKQTAKDPLFCINHLFATMRCDIKSLARKTWCHPKSIDGLYEQIWIWMDYFNNQKLPYYWAKKGFDYFELLQGAEHNASHQSQDTLKQNS